MYVLNKYSFQFSENILSGWIQMCITLVSYVEGHEKAQKSNFLQKKVITVKELLNILHDKFWNKYEQFQAKSDIFDAT